MQFITVEADPDGRTFRGKYAFTPTGGSASPVPDRWKVRLEPDCDKGTFLFIFDSGCAVGDVGVMVSTQPFEDTGPTPDENYVFDVRETRRTRKDDCVILTFQWRMWRTTIATVPAPWVAGGSANLWLGAGGQASGEAVPYLRGGFRVRVCCVEGDDGCAPTCTLLDMLNP